MGRLLFGVLILAALAGGYPYASLLISHLLGTQTAVLTYADGTRRALISGPDAPRPDWLPIMPGARIVTADRWVVSPVQPDAGDVELAVRATLEEVKRFHMESLAAAGFDMRDLGIGPLTPPAAAYLGVAGMLSGYNHASGIEIGVDIRTPSGWIYAATPVQVRWRKTDGTQPMQDASAGER